MSSIVCSSTKNWFHFTFLIKEKRKGSAVGGEWWTETGTTRIKSVGATLSVFLGDEIQ